MERTNHGLIECYLGCHRDNAHVNNLFFENNILYSYGQHFPLAVRLSDDSYIVNGDKYSITTSGHQSILHSALWRNAKQFFTISFRCLKNAMLMVSDIKTDNIIDKTDDLCVVVQENTFKMSDVPTGATVKKKDNEYFIHRPASLLLEVADKYYLCSMDEASYFISLLNTDKKEPKTIQDAFRMLTPDIVTDHIEHDYEVKRQGEYFLINTGLKAPFNNFKVKDFTTFDLPQTGANIHRLTKGTRKYGKFYAYGGTIRHIDQYSRRATGEHKMVRMDRTLHIVVENTAINSWSESGVD